MPINPLPIWRYRRRPRLNRPLAALALGLGILAGAVAYVLHAWPTWPAP
jgi:hypothetical protein